MADEKLTRPEKHLTCGCCSDGCRCINHMDIPRGVLQGACAYHAALPCAPLDRTYRYDVSISEYVYVPRSK